MDSKEILAMMEALSVHRGIKKESVALALESSIEAAVGRQLNISSEEDDVIIKVEINRNTGHFDILKLKLKEGVELEEEAEISDLPRDQFDVQELHLEVFDRVAIQTAKQLIMQKVKEAERQQLADDYNPLLNKLVSGVVKRITRTKDVIVLINERVEAVLPFDNLLPQDNYELDDDISAVLIEVDSNKINNQLFLSRTADAMVREMFVREVPEISQQIVEICAIARLPGLRSKVAIRAKDHRIDAMSACIGIQGRRVQAVQKELRGEKIDILEWDDNPDALVRNVLASSNVLSVSLNPTTHVIDVATAPEHVGEILGRNGQNIRLASSLIGWEINLLEEEDAAKRRNEAMDKLKSIFTEVLDADDDLVNDLIGAGFDGVKQVAYAPTEKFLRIEGFDEELVNEIRNRAREYLLSDALSGQDENGYDETDEEKSESKLYASGEATDDILDSSDTLDNKDSDSMLKSTEESKEESSEDNGDRGNKTDKEANNLNTNPEDSLDTSTEEVVVQTSKNQSAV